MRLSDASQHDRWLPCKASSSMRHAHIIVVLICALREVTQYCRASRCACSVVACCNECARLRDPQSQHETEVRALQQSAGRPSILISACPCTWDPEACGGPVIDTLRPTGL